MEREVALVRIATAIEALRQNDAHLLEVRCSERSIVGRLQVYLAGVFPSHDVDIEYNRHGIDKKRVQLSDQCRKLMPEGALVVPDIVIHTRGNDERNTVVMEVKPDDRDEGAIECDREKLAAIKSTFGYAYSVLLIVPVGNECQTRPSFWEWNGDGHRVAVA
jgi:hypothetical protein